MCDECLGVPSGRFLVPDACRRDDPRFGQSLPVEYVPGTETPQFRAASSRRLFHSPHQLPSHKGCFNLPHILTRHLLLAVLLLASIPSISLAQTREIQYSGSLTQLSRNGDSPAPVKQFELYSILRPVSSGHECFHVITERGGGGWAWPERFGVATLDDKHHRTNGRPPHVLHTHDAVKYPVETPLPLFEFADRIAPDANWMSGKLEYVVKRKTEVSGKQCWQIDATDNFGRRQTFFVDQDSPTLIAAERRVFMGRGDEFTLRMSLTGSRTLDAPEAARVQASIESLQSLQASLERSEGTTKPELSAAQIETTSAALPALVEQTEGIPLNKLVIAMSRDVRAQSQRAGDVSSLQKKFVGQPIPGFVLPTLKGATLDSASLKGKITVLHFWEYQGEPLEEPYGQVGYLDFLLNRRGRLGVSAVGIAVNEELAKPETQNAAKRSVRKLRDFMNLGYPIALDGGILIKQLGDPRQLDASLPLWVVVGPDGKIAHYHVGIFPINPDEGLRDLDAVVVRLIREQRAAEK